MAKGIKVGKGLVNYNTKVEPQTKELTEALVDVLKTKGIASQRQLIEDMLEVYEAANPAAFTQARKLMEIKQGGYE